MTDKKKKPAKKAKPPSALKVVPGREAGTPVPKGRKSKPGLTVQQYVEGVRAGDRTVLGRAITLVESRAPAHQTQAQELLEALIPHSGGAIRLGITGTPGAGKSTFIETLGCKLVEQDTRVAVMAVDPSSSISRGSILGDKTRMERLSQSPGAFIRPSPTSGTLGGVARKTREAMVLFEAAGYEVIIVETVGVGQSEIVVRSMVDFFLLLLVAGGGDELQGIKRGVMELADAVVVNKADGENRVRAETARSEFERALHYLAPATEGWQSRALCASARTGDGIDEVWATIRAQEKQTRASGRFDGRRRAQTQAWLHRLLEEKLKARFYSDPEVAALLPAIEQAVRQGTLPAVQGALRLFEAFEKKPPAD